MDEDPRRHRHTAADHCPRLALYGEDDCPEDDQDKLERQMLGGWDDSAFLEHLAYLRARSARESVA